MLNGNYCVCEIQPSVGVDVWLAQADRVNEPVELIIPVHVLGGAKGVGHTFDAVHDGASEVVRGIDLKVFKLQLETDMLGI